MPARRTIKLISCYLRLSQSAFAEAYGIPVRTLQNWEAGRREPEEGILSYLSVIADMPDQVRRSLRKSCRASTRPSSTEPARRSATWPSQPPEFLARSLPPTLVLRGVRQDKYGGRVVARVSDHDGRDVGSLLVQARLAVPIGGTPAWCD